MAGRTISAHADEQIFKRMRSLAKAEARPVSQLASVALKSYAFKHHDELVFQRVPVAGR